MFCLPWLFADDPVIRWKELHLPVVDSLDVDPSSYYRLTRLLKNAVINWCEVFGWVVLCVLIKTGYQKNVTTLLLWGSVTDLEIKWINAALRELLLSFEYASYSMSLRAYWNILPISTTLIFTNWQRPLLQRPYFNIAVSSPSPFLFSTYRCSQSVEACPSHTSVSQWSSQWVIARKSQCVTALWEAPVLFFPVGTQRPRSHMAGSRRKEDLVLMIVSFIPYLSFFLYQSSCNLQFSLSPYKYGICTMCTIDFWLS